MSGYVARRDGLTDDDGEALLAACKRAFDMSGSEIALRALDGTWTDEDRAKVARMRGL